jgi:hypothetical protein
MTAPVRARLTYANVMSTLAVFIALGGTSMAAMHLQRNSVTSAAIAKGAVTGTKIHNHAITAAKVKPGSLLASNFKAGQLLAGATGPQGPKGDPGPATGPAGGALTGSYPNPQIADGAVGTSKLASGAVTAAKLGLPLALSGSANTPFLTFSGSHAGTIGDYTASASMLGVTNTNTSAVGPSIYGETNSIFGNALTAGIAGNATGTGGYGVYALHSSSSGYGVALAAVSNGPGTAASFTSSGQAGSKAATFSGDVSINGTLTKTAGSFRIDDPIDPAHEYLSHSFVESPDMLDVYEGVITTGANGRATVRMPRWFQALNGHYRYQLTVIGSRFAQAIVSTPMSHNRFSIRTSHPRVRVSWQVTGVREDPYARAHRIPTEQRKVGRDDGRYLQPRLYGQPASKAIGAGG